MGWALQDGSNPTFNERKVNSQLGKSIYTLSSCWVEEQSKKYMAARRRYQDYRRKS